MSTFGELLRTYTNRTGITDAELARSIGVRRQTIFRWKEGTVARPRSREDVLNCAKRLRLTPDELDQLLLAAGFSPERVGPPAQSDNDFLLPEDNAISANADSATFRIATTPSPHGSTPALSNRDGDNLPDNSPARSAFADHFLGRVRHPHTPTLLWGALAVVPILALIGLFAMTGWGANAAPTPVPTLTPTAVLVIVDTPPTPTPIRLPIIPAGQTGLLVARFSNYIPNQGFNVAGRIQRALQAQIESARLANTMVALINVEIENGAQSQRIISDTGASLLIWGEFDSGGVRVELTTANERSVWERQLPSPDALAPTINADVPQEVRTLALYILGRLYRGDGKTALARTAFEEALSQEPPDDIVGHLYFYLASLYDDDTAADLTQAIEQYTKATQFLPDDTNALYNRGLSYWHRYRIYGDRADLTAAIDDLAQTIRLNARYAQAYTNRGIAYYSRNEAGDLTQAVEDFTTAIGLMPNAPLPYYNRALARIRLNEAGWAEDLQRAAELDPADVRPLTGLCWGYALSAEPEAALPYCDQAIEREPEKGDSRDGRGIVYARLGRIEDAITEFEAYLTWLRAQPPAYFERFNGPRVEEWVRDLQEGKNPFTSHELDQLR